MNLVPRYDDPRPKTLQVTGRTIKSLQTDGRTDGRTTPYHNTSGERRAYNKSEFSTPKHCFLSSLVDIGLVVLEKNIF